MSTGTAADMSLSPMATTSTTSTTDTAMQHTKDTGTTTESPVQTPW
jgi:hypothetical protein